METLEFNPTEVENEISQYIIDIIKNCPTKQIYSLLRENEYITINVPKMELGNYTINSFDAEVSRVDVERILFYL